EAGAIQLQLTLTPAEAQEGGYEIAIYSRPQVAEEDENDDERLWTRHAGGTLAVRESSAQDFDGGAWPPLGAEAIGTEDFYDFVGEIGIDYGPAFQGLDAAWRDGDDIYAEVSLDPEQAQEAQRFGIHPALLDAALHTVFVDADPADGVRLPFSFAGVDLHGAPGASALRIRLTSNDERISLQATDGEGSPVVSVGSLVGRPIDPAQLRGRSPGREAFLGIEWADLELPDAAPFEPKVHCDPAQLLAAFETSASDEDPTEATFVFECIPREDPDAVGSARALNSQVLELAQAFLANEQLAGSRLAILTRGATIASPEESPDLASASVWGLVRSAQSEHPGRLTLIDSDGSEASDAALPAALGIEDEPQLALREGRAAAPRLERVKDEGEAQARPIDPDGTVLVTGGLTGLGALSARHLATEHGAKHLLLVSRRGAEAPGAKELVAELAELGCEAEAVACDVSERDQLAALLAKIPEERSLTAVIHSAGTADNGLIEDQSPAGIDKVFAPKADAAWHLHELTKEMDLASFVLFSSTAGTFYNPGTANYAAANAFLDALAKRRHAEGLVATAVAWGLWLEGSELAQELNERELARLRRDGFLTLSSPQVLEFFDRAQALGKPHLIAAPLDLQALRSLARSEMLQPLFFGLVPTARRRARGSGGSLARRLSTVPEADREALVLEVVGEHVATVLGHSSADAVDPATSFKDLGFDSLGAVELRNRLVQATG
ncbi:MAG TPA: type I polyketide synthase, partial [Solirubrobacterales bacterium]